MGVGPDWQAATPHRVRHEAGGGVLGTSGRSQVTTARPPAKPAQNWAPPVAGAPETEAPTPPGVLNQSPKPFLNDDRKARNGTAAIARFVASRGYLNSFPQ